MSLTTLLLVYLLGGITFIPLLAVAAFASLLYLSPPVGDADPAKGTKDKLEADAATADEQEKEKVQGVLPKPLQGWIIVRRTFEEPAQDGASYVGNLVRSWKNSTSSTSSGSHPRRPRDTFYAVLKGTVLYLYEDEACSDCYAALQVAAYDVDIWPNPRRMTDGELFAKRNAIRLKARGSNPSTPNGMPMVSKDMKLGDGNGAKEKEKESPSSVLDEQHFIFVKSNIQMEDWYLALVYAATCDSNSAPSATSSFDPLASLEPIFSTHDMAHLVQTLDQQADPIPMRWLNALVGRIFYSLYRTAGLEANLIARLMKKIGKVPRPAFLTEIVVREVNVGTTAPLLSKPMLKELTKEGDASVELGLSYKSQEGEHSGIRIIVEATVTIDIKDSLPLNLGNRFDLKPRNVKLVLAVVLRSMEGNLLVRIKRPPSNRIWYGFTSMPQMQIELLPIVSDRKIKWGLVLKPIENLLREVIQDSIVLPNMDDIPFFDTDKYEHRGGIFNDAVRTVYDLTSTATAEPSSTTMISADGSTRVDTVSPSTNIPINAELAATDKSADMSDEQFSSLSMPGDFSSPTPPRSETPTGRTGTTASLPTHLPSTSPKRPSWLPRFVGGKNHVERPAESPVPPASPAPLNEATSQQPTPSAESRKANDSEQDVPTQDEPERPELELDMPPIPAQVVNLEETPSSAADMTPTATQSDMSHLAPVQESEETTPTAPSTSSTPFPARTRSSTLAHHVSQSAAGDFYSPPMARAKSSEPKSDPPSVSPKGGDDDTVTSAGITPGSPTSTPSTPSLSRSLSGKESNASTGSATQTLLSAWKNRTIDKQMIAATARDVGRDAMKKWGFGQKKDTPAEAGPSSDSPLKPAFEPNNSRPATPDKKTYEQLRAEVAERHEKAMQKTATPSRRKSVPRHSGDDDVFENDHGGSNDGDARSRRSSVASPFRPPSPKPTTHLHTGPKGPTSPAAVRDSAPPLPPRDLAPDIEERGRRLSNTSQSSLNSTPVQKQPGQLASMRIPGIHASHRGEVMAMGSAPPPSAAPSIPEEQDPASNRAMGPKTAATIQSVYRLFKRENNANASDPSTPSPEDAPSVTPPLPPRASPVPPPLPARRPQPTPQLDQPSPSEEPRSSSPQPSVHERTESGSSAASVLKQIQATDANRSATKSQGALNSSRPVSIHGDQPLTSPSQVDVQTPTPTATATASA